MLNILIVEDEVLIADRIAHYLQTSKVLPDTQVVGPASSYNRAVDLVGRCEVDLALIDIRIQGNKTGLDFATWLHLERPSIPFIFLTSQFGPSYLEAASALSPRGYLSKPIQPKSLCATVLLAVQAANQTLAEEGTSVMLSTGQQVVRLAFSELLYLQADHVYVRYYRHNKPVLIARESLTEAEQRLPKDRFLRIHRSYIVNKEAVRITTTSTVTVGEAVLPIGRSRQREVKQFLSN